MPLTMAILVKTENELLTVIQKSLVTHSKSMDTLKYTDLEVTENERGTDVVMANVSSMFETQGISRTSQFCGHFFVPVK